MSILNNTPKLQSLLEKINALPEAENLDDEMSTQTTLLTEQDAKIAELAEVLASKASISYPTLSNPATAENLQEGYELIDGNGNVVVGTHVCSGGSNIEIVVGTIKNDSKTLWTTSIGYLDENLTFQLLPVSLPRYQQMTINVVKDSILACQDLSMYAKESDNLKYVFSGATFVDAAHILGDFTLSKI